MFPELISKILLLLFGYACPAFECFKMVEQRPNDVHQLRFWCQYWIIVGMVLAFESLISWIPAYNEVKLAFFLYLWYPKTKGSDAVYETFVRPVVMQYEPNIEQRLLVLRAKAGEFLTFYIKNFTDKGTAFFMEVLRYVVADKSEGSQRINNGNKRSGWSPFATRRPSPPPPPPAQKESFLSDPDLDAQARDMAAKLRANFNAKPRRSQQNNDKYY